MNIMATPKFLINDILNSNYESIDKLKNTLYSKGIQLKEYKDDNLLLIYTNFNTLITSELQRECRSLVVDFKTSKIISYSCETPLLNNDGLTYLKNKDNINDKITICYDGSYVSLFFHNNKWYFSTRKNLIHQDQNEINCKQYDMFIDIIKNYGSDNFNIFCDNLDKNKSYHFTLIHYMNKNIIDYTKLFGNNYMKLCLTNIRNNEMKELDLYENPLYSNDITDPIFIIKNENYNNFIEYNQIIHDEPTIEGIIIHKYDDSTNKYKLVKLQTLTYQFYQFKSQHINWGLLFLYQNNKLSNYLNINKNMRNIHFNNKSYNTITMINAIFKTLSIELIELYYNLWDDNLGIKKNNELYENLSKIYKEILYKIRGIYFKNKKIDMNDIYSYLKKIDTKKILLLLESRYILNSQFYDYSYINCMNYYNYSTLCDAFYNCILH